MLTDLFHLGQLSTCVLIVSQVFLVSHKNNGHIGAEVLDLRSPLLWNILYIGNKVDKMNTRRTRTEYRSETGAKCKRCEILPKLSGLSMEKHIRITSVSGYERGLSLS